MKLDAPGTPTSKNTLRTLNTGDKLVANHFNQTDHTIHNIHVKGLWLLFTDRGNDRKDMESRLIDKLGSRKPGGMNEKLDYNHIWLSLGWRLFRP